LVAAAYRSAAARAEFAWAEGDVRNAVRHTAEATFRAEEWLFQYDLIFRASVQKVGSHAISASELSEIIEARARWQQAVLRALTVAKHAKVDVTGLKIEYTSGDTKVVRSLSDVLKLVRGESETVTPKVEPKVPSIDPKEHR
jgi:hypothetical protein